MFKLSNEIKKKMKSNYFSKNNTSLEIILSDSQVPGEGEHKFIPEIKNQDITKKYVNCIYSPDADLIVLSLSTHRENIYIIREPKDSDIEKNKYKTTEYIYLSIDVTRNAFLDKLRSKNIDINNKEIQTCLINDLVFLTLLCGNDFIIPPTYMLVRNKGLDMILIKYKEIYAIEDKFLIYMENGQPNINMNFFKKLILSISDNELRSYQYHQKNRDKTRKGFRNSRVLESEKDKSEYDIAMARYNHEAYYSPANPYYKNIIKNLIISIIIIYQMIVGKQNIINFILI